MTAHRTLLDLMRASHIGPVVAVAALAALLGLTTPGLTGWPLVRLVLAVFVGQLTIGWSNDLIDASRDGRAGRLDKPLATGALSRRTVRIALIVSVAASVPLSVACGVAAGAAHVVLVMGSGWAYNLGVKSTVWSWLPYAVAFGSLPAVVTLARPSVDLPPVWMAVTGAALGVGAHFLNVLPDLDDDRQSGVCGLPHRLGGRTAQLTATSVLVLASVAVAVGQDGPPTVWSWAALGLVGAAAIVGLGGRGRTPFRAAIVIALVDVALLAHG